MRKIVASLIAGGLLVGAAFVTTAIVGGAASAEEDDTGTTPDPPKVLARAGHVLDEVLDDLVADGTLSEDQAQAVKDALAAKVRELAQDRPPITRHPFRFGLRLGALLDDGGISADELADLPDGHWLKDPDGPAAPYLDDGQITIEEVRSLIQDLRQMRDTS